MDYQSKLRTLREYFVYGLPDGRRMNYETYQKLKGQLNEEFGIGVSIEGIKEHFGEEENKQTETS